MAATLLHLFLRAVPRRQGFFLLQLMKRRVSFVIAFVWWFLLWSISFVLGVSFVINFFWGFLMSECIRSTVGVVDKIDSCV